MSQKRWQRGHLLPERVLYQEESTASLEYTLFHLYLKRNFIYQLFIRIDPFNSEWLLKPESFYLNKKHSIEESRVLQSDFTLNMEMKSHHHVRETI